MSRKNEYKNSAYALSYMYAKLSCKSCRHYKENKETGFCDCEYGHDAKDGLFDPEQYHGCVEPTEELLMEGVKNVFALVEREMKSDKPDRRITQGGRAILDRMQGIPRKEIALRYRLYTREAGKNIYSIRTKQMLSYLPNIESTAAVAKWLTDDVSYGTVNVMAFKPQTESWFYKNEYNHALSELVKEQRIGKDIILDKVAYQVLYQDTGYMLVMAEIPEIESPFTFSKNIDADSSYDVCESWLANRPEAKSRIVGNVRLLTDREYENARIRKRLNQTKRAWWLNNNYDGKQYFYAVEEDGNITIKSPNSKKVYVRPCFWVKPDEKLVRKAERIAASKVEEIKKDYHRQIELEEQYEAQRKALSENTNYISDKFEVLAKKEAHFMAIRELNQEEKDILLNSIRDGLIELYNSSNLSEEGVNRLAGFAGITARL